MYVRRMGERQSNSPLKWEKKRRRVRYASSTLFDTRTGRCSLALIYLSVSLVLFIIDLLYYTVQLFTVVVTMATPVALALQTQFDL
jgi:hypothetical protein